MLVNLLIFINSYFYNHVFKLKERLFMIWNTLCHISFDDDNTLCQTLFVEVYGDGSPSTSVDGVWSKKFSQASLVRQVKIQMKW